MEVMPDWGCDGGLFLRSGEDGSAYQVMLDYLPGGNMGGVIGERLVRVGGQRGSATDFQDTANHAKGGIEEGPIGIQMHGGNRRLDGGFWRWRVIAVKDLP